MNTVRELFQGAIAPGTSYSIYRGVEDDDGAELHIQDAQGEETTKKKPFIPRISRQYQRIIIGVIVTALIAFLLGYVVTRVSCKACVREENGAVVGEEVPYAPWQSEVPGKLYWSDLKEMFNKYLQDGQQIGDTIRTVSRRPHPAGSDEVRNLAQIVQQKFKSFSLDHTWVDSHFAELQYPDSSRPNFLHIVDSENKTAEKIEISDPDLYCAYSAARSVMGGLLYAHYGRREDFQRLLQMGIHPNGQLVIVRAGGINFAEKVSNAQAAGAVGVLIYPDTTKDTAVYGHVHLGTGDPSTPGFPSFNHTQFPPFKSSGLPQIPAQPISTGAANILLSRLSGSPAPPDWKGNSLSVSNLGPTLLTDGQRVHLGVQNVGRSVELTNVFGSVTGRSEPEHYIVVGAQRDSWGPGAAKSGVGTAILLELARTISVMVHNGFHPRRSLLFVSWDAGDFGSVGATEWLEGYLSMLHLKAAAYMSLDAAVLGNDKFIAKTSPLFKSLIQSVIKQVDSPSRSQQSIYEAVRSRNSDWEKAVLFPLPLDTAAFAFTAFAGVPAVEFSFVEETQGYQSLDTKGDTYEALNELVGGRLPAVALSLAQVAGLALVKLSHEDILPLDYSAYSSVLLQYLIQIHNYYSTLRSRGLSLQWLSSARGDYVRATESLRSAISKSDLNNDKVIQAFNVRIMRVEFYFLSQYVSATESPYRHILLGRGNHTVGALIDHLKQSPEKIDDNQLRKQLALFTWTLKGAANALSGDVWEIQSSF